MSITFKITGLKKTNLFFNNMPKNVRLGIAKGMKTISLFMEGEVKSSVAGQEAENSSVDTGRFLNSVKGTSNSDEAIIFSKVKYAEFLEFGTSRLEPRSHFRNSLFRNQKKLDDFLERTIENELK